MRNLIQRRTGPAAEWCSFLFLVFLTALVGATASVVLAQEKKADGPQMEIEPEEHDFGNVQQNQNLVHEFTITNTGSEDLIIRRISTSCGCTAALVSENVVPAGESTTLEVKLETRKYKGVVQRSISVASNDKRRVRTVRVKAFVETKGR